MCCVRRSRSTDRERVIGVWTERSDRHSEALRARLPGVSSESESNTLPRKRVGAGVLLRNASGDVLLVEPTYKDGWEIPGGLVEDGESPREAARRECMEELGLDLVVGVPLCIHYAEGTRTPGDGVMFVFDAGDTALGSNEFSLPPDELRSAAFVAPDRLEDHLSPTMATRMKTAVLAASEGRTIYLER
jgi:8-oxo-dGTP diphosphatase